MNHTLPLKKKTADDSFVEPRYAIEYKRLMALPRKTRRKMERDWKKPIASIALTLALGSSVFSPIPVKANGLIIVNATTDTQADDGVCTLREAIANANTDGQLYSSYGECAGGYGADEITFDSAVFSTPQEITLGGTQLQVSDDATITGPGRDMLTINGDNLSRVI